MISTKQEIGKDISIFMKAPRLRAIPGTAGQSGVSRNIRH
jgi:hypothetical protein